MNIWQELGINYTRDTIAIRKAYAERTKQCHPEEHPEEFQRLNQAYNTAMRMARARLTAIPPEYLSEVPVEAEPEQREEAPPDFSFDAVFDEHEPPPAEEENDSFVAELDLQVTAAREHYDLMFKRFKKLTNATFLTIVFLTVLLLLIFVTSGINPVLAEAVYGISLASLAFISLKRISLKGEMDNKISALNHRRDIYLDKVYGKSPRE